MEGHLHAKSFGGTCNWPHTRGARLIEVAATAGGTVPASSVSTAPHLSFFQT